MKTSSILLLSLVLLLMGCTTSGGPLSPESNVVHAGEPPVQARWAKTEIPLTVLHYESPFGHALAQGFWQSTSSSKGKQLIFPIAVTIACDREQRMCREADATVQMGILNSELVEYEIATWKSTGIVADDTDERECGTGHRLILDFKSNSVTVTDYPKKLSGSTNCKPFQDANSYALHGGQLMLYPPAPWDPLEGPKH
jgi:hypothetical protein